MESSPDRRITLGISACLLGAPVRYDGQHAGTKVVSDVGDLVDFVPVCPEMGAGLGVPRPTLHLRGRPDALRIVDRQGRDQTEALTTYSARALDRLAGQSLSGFVVKSRSPSCGLQRVGVLGDDGVSRKVGEGIFTKKLRERFPLLPIEEDGRLRDPVLRETFLGAVYAYRRWQDLQGQEAAPSELMKFHARHKYQLLAHDPAEAKRLGHRLARWKEWGIEHAMADYGAGLLHSLRRPANTRRHENALLHMLGHLRGAIDSSLRREIRESIDDYVHGHVGRDVPTRMIGACARSASIDYIANQTYLSPYPGSLARAR